MSESTFVAEPTSLEELRKQRAELQEQHLLRGLRLRLLNDFIEAKEQAEKARLLAVYDAEAKAKGMP